MERYNLYKNLTPAVLAYEGIAYQYMAPVCTPESIAAGMVVNLQLFDNELKFRIQPDKRHYSNANPAAQS